MKKLTIILATLALWAAAPLIEAQSALLPPSNGFSTSTTNANVSPSYAIIGTRSANGGSPAIYAINAGSDLASSTLSSYKVTGQTVGRYATNSTVTLSVAATNGFASGTVIVIQHLATDNYEKRILTTMGAATNLITTVAPLEAVVPGDVIYAVSTVGASSLKWGASTNNLNGGGGPIIVGQKGKPLLVEITGTSVNGLYNVSGVYLP